jgi:large subunit ribosomal protein L34
MVSNRDSDSACHGTGFDGQPLSWSNPRLPGDRPSGAACVRPGLERVARRPAAHLEAPASVSVAGAAPFRIGTVMKRTYQASKTRRARTHGFLVRMKTRGGRAIINARRAKGRKRLAV